MPASAQVPAENSPRRLVAFADVGYGTSWDDEGLLGRGVSVSGGLGFRITRRLTIQALIDRIGYYRDVEWLTFDGRILFAGVEGGFQSAARVVRPYVTVGAGVLNDDGIWIRKTQVALGSPRVEERSQRDGTHRAMTVSAGVDIPVSSRAFIRAGARFYGLLQTGDDLFPHLILQPTVGTAIRW